MKSSSVQKRTKQSKTKDSSSLQQIKFIEIKRKSSMSDSNESGQNSPHSSIGTVASANLSEVDEMSMLEMNVINRKSTNKPEAAAPFIPQTLNLNRDVFKVSHNVTTPRVIRAPLKSGGSTSKSLPYTSNFQNAYASLGSDPPQKTQYRGGRKKEAPPPLMTEEERKQWEKERLKKDNHNIIEKRRRYKINECITVIGRLLPPADIQNNKGTILETAIDYIKHLQADQVKHEQLRLKFELLLDTNKQLREAQNVLKNSIAETMASGCNFELQDSDLNLFDISDPIKQEFSNEAGNNFVSNVLDATLDFSKDSALLCDDMIFMKMESHDGDVSLSKQPDLDIGPFVTSGNMDEPFDLMDQQNQDDMSLKTPVSSLFAIPEADNLIHADIFQESQESFYYGSFIDVSDPPNFADMSDGCNSMDQCSLDYNLNEDGITLLK